MQKFEHDSLDDFCKLNKNSQRWYFAWENLQEVFVMLVVVLHSLLFLSYWLVLFLRFWTTYFTMPPALHPCFLGTQCLHQSWALPWLLSIVSFSVYRERHSSDWAFFTHRSFLPYVSYSLFATFLALSLVVSDLRLETKGSRFESGC